MRLALAFLTSAPLMLAVPSQGLQASLLPAQAGVQDGGARETGRGGPTEPAPLSSAESAISNGVEKLCAWFVHGEGYWLPAAFQTAAMAGFQRGASVQMIPLPEMRERGSYSTIAFQARIADAPASGSGVAAFFSFHTPVCQLQVYGYRDDANRYIARLKDGGWTLVGEQRSENVLSERWLRSSGAQVMTLVVNRWVGAQATPGDLGFILNVLPGEDRERGDLQ